MAPTAVCIQTCFWGSRVDSVLVRHTEKKKDAKNGKFAGYVGNFNSGEFDGEGRQARLEKHAGS